jgi:hypothetical protein
MIAGLTDLPTAPHLGPCLSLSWVIRNMIPRRQVLQNRTVPETGKRPTPQNGKFPFFSRGAKGRPSSSVSTIFD